MPDRPKGSHIVTSNGRAVDPKHIQNPKIANEMEGSSAAVAASGESQTQIVQRLGDGKLPYCEDCTIWHKHRVAIFSCDPGRADYDSFTNSGDIRKAKQGCLMVCYLDTKETHSVKVFDWPAGRTFHPLGVGLLPLSNHEALLAVCNLGADFAAVEMLTLKYRNHATPAEVAAGGRITATFLQSLQSKALTSPNAVVPLSPDKVLVTNSFGFNPRGSKILNDIETMLAVPLGSLLCITKNSNTVSSEIVAPFISLANGVSLSEDGKILLLAGCTSQNIHVYDISPPANAASKAADFHFRETIPVGFLPDNLRYLDVDSQGVYTFLVAGLPSAIDAVATASSKGKFLAPSAVAKILIEPRGKAGRSGFWAWYSSLIHRSDSRIVTVFRDDGGLIGNSSTAVAFESKDHTGREMIVTGLWDARGPILCTDVNI